MSKELLETVVHKCPGCGHETKNIGTKKFNIIWLQHMKGKYCWLCKISHRLSNDLIEQTRQELIK